eukprot:81496_1
MKYIGELIGALYSDQRFTFNEYGKCVWGGFTFVDPGKQQIGLLAALFIVGFIILSEIGYESSYGESTHVRMTNAVRAQGGSIVKSIDWKNFIFRDGKNMKYFLQKLKNVDEVSRQFVVQLLKVDIQKQYKRSKYGENAWKMYIDRNITLFKMIRKQKLGQSKL